MHGIHQEKFGESRAKVPKVSGYGRYPDCRRVGPKQDAFVEHPERVSAAIDDGSGANLRLFGCDDGRLGDVVHGRPKARVGEGRGVENQ
jgi:hypothetical protein